MMPLELMTAPQISAMVAERVRRRRLDRAWTQQALADRAGMSLSSLRRFERTGQVSFLSLVRLALALDAVDALAELFPERPQSLDEVLERPRRKRGRRSRG